MGFCIFGQVLMNAIFGKLSGKETSMWRFVCICILIGEVINKRDFVLQIVIESLAKKHSIFNLELNFYNLKRKIVYIDLGGLL